jgi:hypothetical protein
MRSRANPTHRRVGPVAGVLLAVGLAGCGGPPAPALPAPGATVFLGEWCQHVGRTFCRATAEQCFGGSTSFEQGCQQSAVEGCLAGRSLATPAGRTGAELRGCLEYLDGIACKDLGAALANPVGASLCAARAPLAPPP